MIVSISSQKVIQHFSRIFRSILLFLFNIVSHISIRTIRFARESSRITSVDSANQSDFFSIDDEVDNISNQKSSLFIKNQIFDHHIESSLLRQEFSIEIIHLLREHCEIISISSAKDFVFSVSELNSISSRQKRQESSSENLTSAFDIKSIHSVWESFEISLIYLASQRFSSIFAMTSIFKSLEVFNSKYFCSDSEKKIFCEIASFLQHL